MEPFAFVAPPSDVRVDAARRYPVLAPTLSVPLASLLARVWPSLLVSRVVGVRSKATRREVEGWAVRCGVGARDMLRLPPQTVYDRIVRAGRLAQRQGAGILGLGPFASVVGDGGVTIAQRLNMPVTTGNSLTVASAIAALEKALERANHQGLDLEAGVSPSEGSSAGRRKMAAASVAVVGASESVGLGCAEMLAPLVGGLILVGRREIHLSRARALAEAAGAAGKVRVSTRLEDIREADLVLSAGNATQLRILPDYIKRNAILCDVTPPVAVSPVVQRERPDVSLIAGGIVSVPGHVDFGFDFGLQAGMAYAYMGEVMVLALEGRLESYSLGQRVHVERVREIAQLARRHGFRLAP